MISEEYYDEEKEVLGPQQRRSLYPRFILGSSNGDNRELHVEAEGLLRNKRDSVELPFSSVTMKWGARKLEASDVLVSMCEKGVFYVAKHVWGTKYRLDDWKEIYYSQFNGNSCSLFSKTKSVNMNFKKKGRGRRGGGDVSKTIITVNSCRFKWNLKAGSEQEWKSMEVTCKGDSGDINQEKEDIVLTLKKRNYRRYYKYTV